MDSFFSSLLGAVIGFLIGVVIMVTMWSDTMDNYVKTKFFTRNGALYHVSEVNTK